MPLLSLLKPLWLKKDLLLSGQFTLCLLLRNVPLSTASQGPFFLISFWKNLVTHFPHATHAFSANSLISAINLQCSKFDKVQKSEGEGKNFVNDYRLLEHLSCLSQAAHSIKYHTECRWLVENRKIGSNPSKNVSPKNPPKSSVSQD